MKKFITRGIALAAAAMFLTGCGDGMPIMSEAEEAIVVIKFACPMGLSFQ